MSLAAMVFEVRSTGNDANGGGFNSARGGTDYTQQDAAQATGTVTSSTTTVTATTAIFTAAMVGNLITDGTTWKEITAYTSSTVVTVDSAPSWTAATIKVGGAIASIGRVGALAGLTVGSSINWAYLKYNVTPIAITTATHNVAGGPYYLTSSYVRFVGYDTTRTVVNTDANRPTIQVQGAISGFNMISMNQYEVCRNLIMDGNTKSVTGIHGNGNTNVQCHSCKVMNAYNGAFLNGNFAGGVAVKCEATNNDQTAGFDSWLAVGCSSRSNTNAWGFQRCITFFCITEGCAYGGFQLAYSGSAHNCVAYNNTGDGFSYAGGTNLVPAVNCISTNNSGKGFNLGGSGLLTNCATYSNTGGAVDASSYQIGSIVLSGSPFTNAAGHDFSLNNTAGAGAACRAAGFPGVFPGGLSTGYVDVGAVQHADPAGGAGLVGGGAGVGFARNRSIYF